MSFRKYGGTTFSAKHNNVNSNINNTSNLYVTNGVGQANSYIDFNSDISCNIVNANQINSSTVAGGTGSFDYLNTVAGTFASLECDTIKFNRSTGDTLHFTAATVDGLTGATGSFQYLNVGAANCNGLTGVTGYFEYFSCPNLVLNSATFTSTIYAKGGITGTTGSFEYLNVESGIINSLTGTTGSFDYLNVGAGNFNGLTGTTGSFEYLNVESGIINSLTGTTGSFEYLNVESGIINSLTGATGSFDYLNVESGNFNSLTGTTGSFEYLNVGAGNFNGLTGATGSFDYLNVGAGNFNGLTGATGSFQYLNVGAGNFNGLTGATGSFQYLTGATGSFNYLNGGTGIIDYLVCDNVFANSGLTITQDVPATNPPSVNSSAVLTLLSTTDISTANQIKFLLNGWTGSNNYSTQQGDNCIVALNNNITPPVLNLIAQSGISCGVRITDSDVTTTGATINLTTSDTASGEINLTSGYLIAINGGTTSTSGVFINTAGTAAANGVTEIAGQSTYLNSTTTYFNTLIGNTTIPGTTTAFSSSVTATYFNATSDYRIKENVKPLDNTFTVDNLNPVMYTLKGTTHPGLGVIAHELQEEYPFMVTGKKDGKEIQSVNYTYLIGILIKEIKDLKKTVSKMKTQIRDLQDKF